MARSDCIGTEHRENIFAGKLFTNILNIYLLHPEPRCFLACGLDFFLLSKVCGKCHHFTVILILQPVEDVREEFARDYIFPMFRANAVYEGEYMLGTSIARPLIAKWLVEIAESTGADAISHGATGKGNDQVRFELSAYALNPEIKIIAPWREWELGSRDSLVAYARQHGLPVDDRFSHSMDANLLHISYEGGELEDPWVTPADTVWRWTVSLQDAPNEPETIEVEFQHGDPVAIGGEKLTPAAMMERLNALGVRHGVGRADLVENRYVGMKSRGCYETPGGTILLKAN